MELVAGVALAVFVLVELARAKAHRRHAAEDLRRSERVLAIARREFARAEAIHAHCCMVTQRPGPRLTAYRGLS